MFRINMKDYRRIITIAIVSALVVGGILLFKFLVIPFDQSDPLEAVPHNSALIIEVASPDTLFQHLKDKPYSKDLKAVHLVDNIVKKWQYIQPVLGQFEASKAMKLVVAAQIGVDNQLDYVFILNNVNRRLDLAELLSEMNITNQERSFNKQTFYNIQFSDTVDLSIAHNKEFLIIAESSVLVESVLDQIQQKSTNILRQNSLKSIRKLTGKNTDLSIYLNMEYIPVFASFFANKSALKNIQFLKFYAEWAGLDVDFQDKNISLNGYLFPSINNQLLKSLKNQKLPKETLIANVLPDNTAAMTYLGYQDASAFIKELSLADNDDFEKYFVPWLGEEMAYLITEPHYDDYNAHKFAIFRIKDSQQAEEQLEQFGEKFGKLDSEQYFNYTIHRIMVNNLLRPIFGNGLNPIQNPYYVVLDDYLILGNSEVGLKELLDKYTYGQTLGQDINYLQFIENLSSTSNKYVYINTANILNILTALFKEELHNDIRQEFEYYQKLTPIGLQLTPYKNLYFLNAQIQYNKKGKQATSVIWKADLDAEAATPPYFVKNHITGDLEVFIQDVNNHLYLFDKNGERIWENPIAIEERIISDVHQIDYFKNTYLQYLFNTKDKIYLIDRTGEKVQGYPIMLPSTANNGMLVVDYDKTRDYRIFIACVDGNIYGFRGTELLDGWSPQANVGQIRFPLQHFSFEEKDYIIALNDAGEMLFFKRNGEERMDSIHFNTRFLSPLSYDLSAPPRIVATNERGKAHVLNFQGKHFKLGMNTGEYENMKFEYADVIGDHRKDYIVLGKKEFGIFSYDENTKFKGFAKRTFDVPQDTLFQVSLTGIDKKYIGTFSSSARRAYLLNGKAELFPDFPIPATTPFQIADLYQDGKNILIVANGNAVFAYKLKQIQAEPSSSDDLDSFALPLE